MSSGENEALILIRRQDEFLQEMEKKANAANTITCKVIIVAKLRWLLYASDSYKLSDKLKEEIKKISSILEDSNVAFDCSKKNYGNIADVIFSTLDRENIEISEELKIIICNLFSFKCFYFIGTIFPCPKKHFDIRGKLF